MVWVSISPDALQLSGSEPGSRLALGVSVPLRSQDLVLRVARSGEDFKQARSRTWLV